MGGAPMMPGGGPDPAKVYKTEQDPAFHLPTHCFVASHPSASKKAQSVVPCEDNLEMILHEFLLDNVETELWRKWKNQS